MTVLTVPGSTFDFCMSVPVGKLKLEYIKGAL